MKAKIASGIMLILLLKGMLILAFNVQPVKSELIIVPDDYPTIQEAVDAASPGDTIYVFPGTYDENVDVYQRLNIYGAGAGVTIVNASDPNDHVFHVTAHNVSISGLTITGAVEYRAGIYVVANYINIFDNDMIDNYRGIFLFPSSGSNITNNDISSIKNCIILDRCMHSCIANNDLTSGEFGMHLSWSNNNTIMNNVVADNTDSGIYLWESNNNTISGNTITNNTYIGVGFGTNSNNNTVSGNTITNSFNFGVGIGFSNNNTVSGNTITNSTNYGVHLHSSSDNIISGNTITNSTNYGVWVYSSSDNKLYHNDFIDNTQQAYISDPSVSANIWDDGYPSGGNYWSDYEERYPTAEELDNSGIWNTPYVVDENNQDNYPLMERWTPPALIHVHPMISYAGIGEAFSIDIGVADVADLYGFEFILGYNTTILDAIDVVVQPFLNEPTITSRREINDELGFLWVDVTSQHQAEPVHGSGTLATIFFQVTGLGECVLDLYDTKLRNPEGFLMIHSAEDGYLEGGMTQVVSTESPLGSYEPSLAVDLAGNVHVAWHDLTDLECGTDLDILYKRYEVDFGWTPAQVVSTESTSDSAFPSLAVDLAGNVHIAWQDATNYDLSKNDWDIFYKNRTSSWSTTVVVSTESKGNSFRPSLAVDSRGDVHIAWHDESRYDGSAGDTDIFYKNRTSSWSTTVVVSTESTANSHNASLAVDSMGDVHIAWADETDYAGCGTDRDIFYKNRTSSWSTTVVVSTESTADSLVPSLAVDFSGIVHIAWDDRDGNWTIFYKRHEVNAGWTYTVVVSTESTANSWAASLAVDLARNVHVAWHDETDYAGCGSDADIFYRYLRVHSTVYPWSMFHHNLMHTGYTESPGSGTNKTKWTYTTGGFVESSPAVVDGIVFVGSNDGYMYAFDQYTGAQVWNYTIGAVPAVYSSPAVAYGKVYAAPFDHKVICLDASTGEHIWNYTTGGWMRSSPAVADGRVYVGPDDAKVYCLDAFTGEHIWNYTTGPGFFTSSPAVAYGNVYVGSTNNKTYCLDASDGSHIWTYTTGGSVESSPAVVDGKVYIGSGDSKVYCLDASSGTLVWNYTTGGTVRSSPAVADGKVYVGSGDSKVYCLNASAASMTPSEREIWNYTTGWFVWSSPAVADGEVHVGSGDSKVYCLNASTGELVWNYTTGGVVVSSPAVADGLVFVGSDDSIVYAIGSVIRVPEDYATIQEAIDAADPGDTIWIAPGKYRERLKIQKKKRVKLLGRKGSSTTFAGGGSGIAVNITDSSEITVTNIEITYWDQGIYIDNSSDCQIYNNVMYLMGDSGIVVDGENAANNQIYNNIFQDNNVAIDVSESSTGNIIYGNTITQNSIGINVVASGGNTIYCNSFIDNGQQVNISSQPNAWDYGSLGNYWSDYTGTDADGDGIGDAAYVIDGNNQDNFPLISPYDYWSNAMLGDINRDAMVNSEDLFWLAEAYGSVPGAPNWNPNCDFNNDYKIAVRDLFNLSKKYGETAP